MNSYWTVSFFDVNHIIDRYMWWNKYMYNQIKVETQTLKYRHSRR